MKLTGVAIKLMIFVVVSVLAGVVVINTLTNPVSGPTQTYHAVFTDATGLDAGSDVRIAGVRVGQVTAVALDNGHADIDFTVVTGQTLPASATATIRYADLLGARYLAIAPGAATTTRLAPDATIPLQRTQPALDLTSLLSGFKPLFDAIDPSQVNQLATELITVFEGENGTITQLLTNVIAVTGNVTGRDKAIGAVLANLNTLLHNVDAHQQDLDQLISGLGQLMSSMAGDRQQIVDAINAGSTLATTMTQLLGGMEPALTHDVGSVNTLAGTLANNANGINTVLNGAPDFLTHLLRTTDYGSWVNVYLCNLSISLGGQPIDLGVGPHSEVCQ